jgi:hypothetical protein
VKLAYNPGNDPTIERKPRICTAMLGLDMIWESFSRILDRYLVIELGSSKAARDSA